MGRFIAGLLLLLIVLGAGAYFFKEPLAGAGLRWAMARAGVEAPSLSVEEITPTRLRLKDVGAGRGAVSLTKVEATYDWRALLGERRVETVVLGQGRVRIDVAGDGSLSVAGFSPGGGGGAPAFPFDALTIEDIAFAVAAPEGEATGALSGAFTPAEGGRFTLSAETESLATDGVTLTAASLTAALDLAADGTLTMRGELGGGFTNSSVAIENAALAFDGTGASWRDAIAGDIAALAAEGRIDLRRAEIVTAESPALAFLAEEARFERGPIRRLSLSGALEAALSDGALTVNAADGARFRVAADRGDVLTLSGVEGAPLYAETRERRQASIAATLTGAAVAGSAVLSAESGPSGPWDFDATAVFDEQAVAGLSLGETRLAATGLVSPTSLSSEISFSTLVKSAQIARLAVRDAALGAIIRAEVDLAEKTLRVTTLGDDCVSLARAHFSIEGQDSDAQLSDAHLCNASGPLVTARWGADARTDVAGRLTATRATYRFGETRFVGAPPAIEFVSDHDPAAQLTRVEGSLSGGRVTLNDAILMSNAAGRFTASLDSEGLKGEASALRLTLAHNAKPAQVAPILANGTVLLADDVFAFDYSGSTPGGAPLGAGEGRHDIRSGFGETTFRSGRLEFRPGGLQPAAILPVLLGLIGETTGAAVSEAHFAWGPQEADRTAAADFVFDDLTFVGPGVAVTQTVGLSGGLSLTSLAPLISDGPQRVTLRGVNLDALQLESGYINFEIPGDETLRVIDAKFPWFGGTIGAERAVASFADGRAFIRLQADKIDLKEVLDYIDVEGLSGEGIISGALPIGVREGRARIVEGELKSDGPGAIRYRGAATETAAAAGDQAEIAFSILRDLRYNALSVTINGPLDGRLDFNMTFEGTGEVPLNRQSVRVPVLYRINLDAALLELLNQANLSRNLELQIRRGLEETE